MKTKPMFFAGLAALALTTTFASAQAWQTVDDFQYVAGNTALNHGLVVAPGRPVEIPRRRVRARGLQGFTKAPFGPSSKTC